MLSNNYFNGSEIELMIGLPEGSGLDASIWGRMVSETLNWNWLNTTALMEKTFSVADVYQTVVYILCASLLPMQKILLFQGKRFLAG